MAVPTWVSAASSLVSARCDWHTCTTVDSYIGKLRSIFSEVGRQGNWNRTLLIGNPASDSLVKQYLKAVTEEQLQSRITPKQATPLFIDKLFFLSTHLDKRLLKTSLPPTELFILARDQAYFKALFFSGDRGGDLGQLTTSEIVRFPQDDGFLFNHVWRKTLRDGTSNLFGMRRHPKPAICPVRAIENYVALCHEFRVNFSDGYLFRLTNPQGHVLDKPFSSSAAEAQLKVYLKEAQMFDGETLHSLRFGSALSLIFSGSSLADTMSRVGWSGSATTTHYLKLANILNAGAPADLLTFPFQQAEEAAHLYTDYDELKNFILTFPTQVHVAKKRPAPT